MGRSKEGQSTSPTAPTVRRRTELDDARVHHQGIRGKSERSADDPSRPPAPMTRAEVALEPERQRKTTSRFERHVQPPTGKATFREVERPLFPRRGADHPLLRATATEERCLTTSGDAPNEAFREPARNQCEAPEDSQSMKPRRSGSRVMTCDPQEGDLQEVRAQRCLHPKQRPSSR